MGRQLAADVREDQSRKPRESGITPSQGKVDSPNPLDSFRLRHVKYAALGLRLVKILRGGLGSHGEDH